MPSSTHILLQKIQSALINNSWTKGEIIRKMTKYSNLSEDKTDTYFSIILFVYIHTHINVCHVNIHVRAKSFQSCPTLQPYGQQPTRLLCPWDSPGKNIGVACPVLLQDIFPTQGQNSRLLVSCIGRQEIGRAHV